MRVAVPAETRPGERRVALVPDAVGKLVAAGLEVVVESGAGRHAFAADDAYREAGATVVDGDVLAGADVVLTVSPLTVTQAQMLSALDIVEAAIAGASAAALVSPAPRTV